MCELSYQEKQRRAIEFLEEAIRKIQEAQTYLKFAIKQGTMNGDERKAIQRVNINLVDPIDEIQWVRDALSIAIK